MISRSLGILNNSLIRGNPYTALALLRGDYNSQCCWHRVDGGIRYALKWANIYPCTSMGCKVRDCQTLKYSICMVSRSTQTLMICWGVAHYKALLSLLKYVSVLHTECFGKTEMDITVSKKWEVFLENTQRKIKFSYVKRVNFT